MKRSVHLFLLTFTLLVTGLSFLPEQSAQTVTAQSSGRPVDFNRDIRPILSDNCFTCHGPDEAQRKARLRFDTKEGAFARQGVIVPGDAASSRLIKRIASKDPNAVMPPADSGYKLTEQQIALLKRWVEEGAKWNEHWAYIAPKRSVPPTVKNASWVRNPIDNFILARLEKEGLKPSPEADKATLLRRVTLDLTGLPPTLAELDAFLNDKSPDAYEKVVDRLLNSPHYGERMAMQWLDLARYADTHGFHIDSHRDMWIWRDWLIKAFNTNKPYDQFTIEQLAGDLLPNATSEQKIASGFNRNHMINFEGGAIPEEYLVEYVVDRVETTANTWMAMTMGCARCHSHKYDPISQKEFYQFFAFFNNVNEVGLDGNTGNAKPFLTLPTDEQKAKLDTLNEAIKTRTELLKDDNIKALLESWQQPLRNQPAEATRDELAAHFELDGNVFDSTGRYQYGRTIKGKPGYSDARVGNGIGIDEQTQISFGRVGNFDNNEPFTLAFWVRPYLSNIGSHVLQRIENADSRRGWELLMEGISFAGIQRRAAPVTFRMTSRWPDAAIQIRGSERAISGEWTHVVISYDGSGKASGVKLWLNGKPDEVEIQKDALTNSIKTSAELVTGSKPLGKDWNGGLDDLRIYNRVLSRAEIEQLAIHSPIQSILSGIYGEPGATGKERLREYFLTVSGPDNLKKAYAELKSLRKEKSDLEKTIQNTMVMSDLETPRDTFVLGRGDYRNKTDKVMPGIPSVLPPIQTASGFAGAFKRRLTRLDLAKWLVNPDHPLTARVAVNRYWQMYFGHGIVKTVEDFGAQGEPPVHPELMDWLAIEFATGEQGDGRTRGKGDAATRRHSDAATTNNGQRTMDNGQNHNPQSASSLPQALRNPQSKGWDIKALQRLIVTSATYRQSSRVTPELHERDPENRLLARGARFRMSAEMIRDNALTVSGLLTRDIGGRSVKPYQPAGLWEEMAFGDGFSEQEYVQSHGKDLYRRSMYTFWKRTVPPAALSVFDAPDREKCVARRAVTNTPLQALITLNDPTYIEAARTLAQRVMKESGEVNARLSLAFRLATARKPSAAELSVLRDLLNQQLANYKRDAKAAAALLKIGESKVDESLNHSELAAWTMVMSTILNLDETITKE